MNLIAPSYMDNNKNISSYNEPTWFLKGQKDVVFNRVSKSPVTKDTNREITKSHYSISNNHASPHGYLGGLFRRGRNGCLDLQNYTVRSIPKSYSPQSAKEPKYAFCIAWKSATIFHALLNAPVKWSYPRNSGVAAQRAKIVMSTS